MCLKIHVCDIYYNTCRLSINCHDSIITVVYVHTCDARRKVCACIVHSYICVMLLGLFLIPGLSALEGITQLHCT